MGVVGVVGVGSEGSVRHLGLDGLRGIAIAVIVLYHGGVGPAGSPLSIDLFLVLSGYLITSLLLGELTRTDRVDLVAFWGRRLRRLLPALLVLVAAVAVHRLLWGDGDPAELRADALATLGYVANWRFLLADGGYFAAFDAPSPLRHAWSLAVEEQWYLLWPPLLWALWRCLGRRPLILVGVLLAGAAMSAGLMARWSADLDRVHYGTDARAQALLVGAALAVWLHHHPTTAWSDGARRAAAIAAVPALGLVAAAFVVAGATEQWVYRGGHLVFALVAGVAVVGVLVSGPGRTAVSLRPLRWLGEVSYGLYLWHWPVFVWLTPSTADLGRWALFAVRVSASLALAVASARWVERPFRHPSEQRVPRLHRHARHARLLGLARPGLTALTATAVTVVVVIGTTAGTHEVAESAFAVGPELPEGFAGEAAAAAPATDPAVAPRRTATRAAPVVLPAPAAAPPDGSLAVAVVGDSTGWTLAWDLVDPPGLDVVDGSVIGCGLDPAHLVVDGAAVATFGQPVDCATAPVLWEHVVTQHQPDVVLLTVGAWEVFDRELAGGHRLAVGSVEWVDWMTDRLGAVAARLTAAAPAALLAIPEVPCFDEREDWLGGPDSARNDAGRVAAVNGVLHRFAAANPARVALLPMDEWLCPGGQPIASIDGTTIRPDGVHVADAGADLLWSRELAPALRSLVPDP